MHIAFIIGSMNNGGAERVVANIANKLCEMNHKITIIMLTEDKCVYEINEKINLVSYKYKSSNKISTFFNAIKSAKQAINDIKPEILISFLTTINIYSIIATLFTSIPIIVSERNDPNSDPAKWYYRFLRNITYKYSNGFVFQTYEAQKFFSKRIQEKSIIIHNPVYINQENICQDVEKTKNIVSVGRLEPQKNHKMLIEAFGMIVKDFAEYTLTIYGEGTLRKELEELIVKNNLEKFVNLPGRVSSIHNEINKSPLFVLASDYEGMSNALMEAMALGLPCISTDCPIGGSSELIENRKNGILVPVGNSEVLAETMRELLTNQKLAVSLGEEAIRISDTHALDVVTAQWENYILEVKYAFE